MTEKRNVEYRVAVHKAAVPLMNGESLGAFSSAIRAAGVSLVKQKLNLTNKSDVYVVEVFGTSAIFDVYSYDQTKSYEDRTKFYAVSYSRDAKSGAFSFGDMVEVKRKTVWEKASTLTTKSVELPEFLPGWTLTGKSLWEGVL